MFYKRYLIFLGPSLLCLAVLAQSPHFDDASQALVNPYPFPVELLLVHRAAGANTVDASRAVRIDGDTWMKIDMPAGTAVARTIPLHLGIPTRAIETCASGATAIPLSPALVREELAVGDRARDDERNRAEHNADQIHAVEVQGLIDTASTDVNDPVRAERISQAERNGYNPYAEAEQNQALTQDAAAVVIGAAMTNDAISAHSAAAAVESTDLDQMIESKQQVLARMENAYASKSSLIATERELNRAAAQELGKSYPASITMPTRPEFGRMCGGAANDTDQLALKMEAPAILSVLLGHARFDQGGEEDIIFRRVAGTPQWTAALYWPLQSSHATIQVRSGKSSSRLGMVETGRPSIERQLSDARKTIDLLKKRRRSAGYAAEGGDESRTVVVP